ncbi:MAG: ATP-binding protein, partial [Planctomycetales bacterium]|nr:ATP-binding protein [Planctomycetales bacterium]
GLRNFARLDEATFQTADIDEGIRQTLMILREPARDANVTLTMDLALERPHPCFPAKLNQVVLNLVNNAIDACSSGGRVTVRSRELGESVEIAVIDDGHGISSEHMSKIFDPFFTTKPVGKGTGLGLSISYRIIREHNGTIHVEPSRGGGTTFRISLPAELESPEGEDEPAPARA